MPLVPGKRAYSRLIPKELRKPAVLEGKKSRSFSRGPAAFVAGLFFPEAVSPTAGLCGQHASFFALLPQLAGVNPVPAPVKDIAGQGEVGRDT